MSAIKRLWEEVALEQYGRVDSESLEKSKPMVEHIIQCWNKDCEVCHDRQSDSRTNPSR